MSWATQYVGIPFADKGRTDAGFDCYGLLCDIYKMQRNIVLPSLAENYESSTDKKQTSQLIDVKKIDWKPVTDPNEFDVVVFNIHGLPTHVGVMLDRFRFIHVMKGRNTAIERITHINWTKRVEGFYRCYQ